jgi:hypothetical protein
MLATALEQHPEIKMYGEVFNPYSKVHGFPIHKPVLQDVLKACEKDDRLIGFIAHTYVGLAPDEIHETFTPAFRSRPEVVAAKGFWSALPDTCKVITLYREDLYARYVSLVRANLTKKWRYLSHETIPEPKPFTIDIASMKEAFARTKALMALAQKRFPNALRLSYEELCEDTARCLNSVQEYLGVKVIDLKPGTLKSGLPPEQIVLNHSEALEAINGWLD